MTQALKKDACSGLGRCSLLYENGNGYYHLNSSIKTLPIAKSEQCSLTIVLAVACYGHQLAHWTETEANGSAEWDDATLTGEGFNPPGASCSPLH